MGPTSHPGPCDVTPFADTAADIPLVNWRYTGEWLDTTNATTGNYKIGLRYYDPGMHRWTQTDPVERVTNPAQPAETQPYTYVGCNPTNQTDPTGAFDLGGFSDAVGLVGACGTGGVLGADVGFYVGAVTPVGPVGGAVIGGLGGCAANVFLGGITGVSIGEGGIA
ncbi:RHS repeat-associated core domain-containing protein [Janibacter sp. UYMM211]|uniref:RHS repeat-associated core domain-containing protein n=1 Tax=Janibacter sp. UYMM211 TaxID=3156342 RepID=UPI0033926E5B